MARTRGTAARKAANKKTDTTSKAAANLENLIGDVTSFRGTPLSKGAERSKTVKTEAVKKAERLAAEAKKAADRAAAEAKKAADKEKKELEKAAAKAKIEVEKAKTEKSLKPVAKEINIKFEKASKAETQADDFRLSAALLLADAQKTCEAGGVRFKAWAEGNVVAEAIGASYENIRKLAAVGAADDPKLALADLRGKNKEANKKARAAKKGKAGKGGGDKLSAGPARTIPAGERATTAIQSMKDDEALNLIKSTAGDLGFQVVSNEAASLVVLGDATISETIQEYFALLGAKDKMAFITWAAEQVGAKVDFGIVEPEEEGDPFDIPESLKRT